MEDLTEYMEDFSDYGNVDWGEFLDVLRLSSGVMVAILAILGVLLLFGIIMYVFESYALFKLAKAVGHNRAWLAWIPYAKNWLMFNLPTKEYKVLAINKVIPSRTVAFWIYIGISVLGSRIMSIFNAIPYIGPFIACIGYLAILVAFIFMIYPMYKDIYLMFYNESVAQSYTLVSVICSFFAPIIPAILMFITSSKAPREIVVESE